MTEFYVFLLGLFFAVVTGALGALFDRTRARSGYLAKQYQDLLAQVFALQHVAARARDASKAAEAAEAVSRAKAHVLKERSCFEAAVSLFGKKKVADQLRTFYANLEKAETVPDKLDDNVKDLTKAFRGSLVSRLSPQKRWFKEDLR